jgi:hypothetical protein
MRWVALLLLIIGLGACSGPPPVPANAALWEVQGPLGRKAWLFGTIHSLEKPADWQSDKVAAALGEADTVVVEIADLDDQAAMAAAFSELSRTQGLAPITARVNPELRDELDALMDEGGLSRNDFKDVEDWAAALMLARAGTGSLDAANGIDRAVIAQARGAGTPVVELEGTRGQLAIFDALPDGDQKALLETIVRDATSLDSESAGLADAWLKGDMQRIELETTRGILADPGLRAALFTLRNHAWKDRIADMMANGQKPFIAVGAAHMAGAEGLPALLEARGMRVTRVQ